MQHDHTTPGQSHSGGATRQRTVSRWVFVGFVLIAGYFLITEHRAHLVGFVPYLPLLFLAACPLLHFFHHGGHSHGDGQSPAPPGEGSGGPSDPVSGGHRH